MPSRKQTSIVGIEMGKASLKLVEFLPESNEVVTLAIKPVEASRLADESYLIEKVRECIAGNMKATPSEVVTSIPSEHAVLHRVDIPNEEDNVLDAIQWELEQYLADSPDNFYTDYQSLGSNAEETTRGFLVAAFRKKEVERVQRVMAGAGLNLTVLDVDIFASQNIFEINYPDQLTSSTLIVKADMQGIKCIWTQKGEFLGFRNLSAPEFFHVADGEDRNQAISQLTDSIKAFLLSEGVPSFVREPVTNLVLCGDLSRDEEFSTMLEADLPMGLVRLNPIKELNYQPRKEEEAMVMQIAPQFATAAGLAIRRGGDC